MLNRQIQITRRGAYRTGRLRQTAFPVPVISIGNLTAGGTGKTPMVSLVARWLGDNALRPAVVARGYRSSDDGVNDEEALLRGAIPGLLYFANPDRSVAIAQALQQDAGVILLDDGFQHLRVARDLDLVLIDGLCPFGGGRCLPAGLLREPLEALEAADVIVVSRSDQISTAELARVKTRLGEVNPRAPLFLASHRPTELLDLVTGKVKPLECLSGLTVSALASIARPESFLATLETLGCSIGSQSLYADHFRYRQTDLADVYAASIQAGTEAIVTTAKDWPKLKPLLAQVSSPLPIFILNVVMCIEKEEDRFFQLIQAVLRKSKVVGED